jgi:hypothetical protein
LVFLWPEPEQPPSPRQPQPAGTHRQSTRHDVARKKVPCSRSSKQQRQEGAAAAAAAAVAAAAAAAASIESCFGLTSFSCGPVRAKF